MCAKILVVDDEPDIQLYLQAALEDEGHAVLLLEPEASFLEIVQRERPDLVCLDILMPRRSGLTLFRRMRQDPDLRGIPVLLISGVARARQLIEAESQADRDAAPIRVMDKPIQIPLLLEAVETLLAALEGGDEPAGVKTDPSTPGEQT